MDNNDFISFTPSVFWWQKFLADMASFSSSLSVSDILSDILLNGLKVFANIPDTVNVTFYELVDGEFILAKEYNTLPNLNFNHTKNLNKLIDQNIIATVISAGKVFYQKSNINIVPDYNVIIIPLVFFSKLHGILLVYINNTKFNLDDLSLNLISLQASQFASAIYSFELNNQVKYLNNSLGQKISQKTLHEKQKRFEISKILDSINSAIFIIDADTKEIIKCNIGALKILGCEKKDLINKTRQSFIVNSTEIDNWINLYSLGNFETCFLTPHNNKINIITSVSEIYYEGKLCLIENFIDVTNAKITKDTLKKHTNFLHGLTETTQSLFAVHNINVAINKAISILGTTINCDRVIVYQNDGNFNMSTAYEWLNSGVKTIKNNPKFNSLNFNKPIIINFYKQLENNNQIKLNFTEIQALNVEYLNINNVNSLLVSPIFADNEFWGVIALSYSDNFDPDNILESKILKTVAYSIGNLIVKEKYIKDLIKAKADAEKSDKIKSDFLTQISHEIRTPLNTILNYTSLIEVEFSDLITDELASYFASIKSAGLRIVRTVDLILNMSEIQNGQYTPSVTKVNLYNTIKSIYLQQKPLAELKKLDFNILGFPENLTINSDDYAISQIFSNLIDNALKFTEKGKVTIGYEDKEGFHNIYIKNTGVGISKEYIPHLFIPFTQEERGYTRRFEGNGLGLALVKQYCNYNNIHLSYKTKKNIGTTFIVSIPKE